MLRTLSWVLMSLFYIGAGIAHFVKPDTYLKIMPPFLPAPLFLVYASGAAEILCGALLWFPALRSLGAWSTIALLIAVLPANIYMYQRGGSAYGIADWVLLWRLPLQLVLIGWAYWHTRP